MKKTLLLAAAALLAVATAQANNLTLTNVTAQRVGAAAFDLQVDAQWDNSWRDGRSWDAAWVFVKFRPRTAGAAWRTATLSTADADHGAPTGVALNAALDGKGVFIYRNAGGAGTFSAPGLRLRWNMAADGVSYTAPGYDIKVFGVEMVNVPQGAFDLNSSPQSTQSNEFIGVAGSLTRISSEAALPAGSIRWADETGGGGSGNVTIMGTATYQGSDALGVNYPKGFDAVYCMKYETSQGQYTDFLNCLTRPQQNRRVAVNISGDAPASGNTYVMADVSTAGAAQRNTIICPALGMGTTAPVTFTCARPDRAANFLIWADGAAYLDWAGLRPMSELEYEKICRGPLPVVPTEYAWGDAAIASAVNISGAENGTETTDATANCVFDFRTFVGGDGSVGPLRGGVFAKANTTRAQSGATYYGVMEMSANCWERCVTVAGQDGGLPTSAGLFDYHQNGDGALDATGDHNVPTWPNSTDVRGSNYRGGNWSRQREWAGVSDRTYGGQAISGRTAHRSIRGVRSESTANPSTGPSLPGSDLPNKFYGGSFDGYAQAQGVAVDASATRPACPSCGDATATLAPNPMNETATLHLSGRGAVRDATLVLYDALGREVRRTNHLSGLTVEVSRGGLAPGFYSYRLSEGGEWVVVPGRFEVK